MNNFNPKDVKALWERTEICDSVSDQRCGTCRFFKENGYYFKPLNKTIRFGTCDWPQPDIPESMWLIVNHSHMEETQGKSCPCWEPEKGER